MRSLLKTLLGSLLGTMTLLWSFTPQTLAATPTGMIVLPSGVYRPLFRGEKDPKETAIPSFAVDVRPVTNADFLEFVIANPRWRRSQVKRLFADEAYLQQWTGDLDFGSPENANRPVVFVSWFAAKAFAT